MSDKRVVNKYLAGVGFGTEPGLCNIFPISTVILKRLFGRAAPGFPLSVENWKLWRFENKNYHNSFMRNDKMRMKTWIFNHESSFSGA